jgi:hypothetical protein
MAQTYTVVNVYKEYINKCSLYICFRYVSILRITMEVTTTEKTPEKAGGHDTCHEVVTPEKARVSKGFKDC